MENSHISDETPAYFHTSQIVGRLRKRLLQHPVELGLAVRALRIAHSMTLTEFARICGVSRSSLVLMESGRGNFSQRTWNKVVRKANLQIGLVASSLTTDPSLSELLPKATPLMNYIYVQRKSMRRLQRQRRRTLDLLITPEAAGGIGGSNSES